MGAAIDAIEPGLAVVRDNPKYIVVAAAVGLVAAALSALFFLIPLLGPLLQTYVISPALLCVVLGMAFAGHVGGSASPSAGYQSLKSNFLSLAGAYLVFNVALGVLAALIAIGGFVPVLMMYDAGATEVTTAGASAVTGSGVPTDSLVLGAILLYLFILLVVLAGQVAIAQFLDAAVIVGGESAISAIGAAWRLFRGAPLSAIGYTLLRVSIGGAVLVAVGVGYAAGATVEPGVALGLGLLGGLLAGPPAGAFLMAYHVTYYDARMGNRTGAS